MVTVKGKSKNKTGEAPGKWTLFFALFLCLFQLFISFPIAIWTRNKFNFEAPLPLSFSVFGLTLFAITLLSISAALLTPRKMRAAFTPLLIALAAAIFIQQNFLAWNYGILDGQTLDFKQNTGLGFLDLTMWGAIIGALILAPKVIKRQATNILMAIGAISIIMVGLNIVNYGPVKTPYSIDERAKFEFSRNKNVIVFLFDAYQMDILLELADTQPDLFKPLEGFTLYENNAAVFAKTYPTIPLFLTGKRYEKKEPLLDFFKLAYKNSLMERMQDEGWDVGLYPHINRFPSLINTIDISPRIMDNAIGGVPSEAKISTYFQAMDLSIFRAVPHILKPAVYNNGEFVLNRKKTKNIYAAAIGETDIPQPFKFQSDQKHPALGFKDLINEHGTLATDDPVFRFYHFMVPHLPFTLDTQLNFVEHEGSFDSFRKYSIAGLMLMGEYLESLKAIGAYDNSTILIVSDHGMGAANYVQYDPETQSYRNMKKHGYRRAAAKSIFLVKPAEQRGALSRSEKPVSGIDVAPTLAAAAGIKMDNFEGKDVDEIALAEERSRLFNFYSFSTWDSKYLDDFESWKITGDVRDRASWTLQGTVTDNVQITNKENYQLGQLMSFGKDIKTDSDFLNAFIDIDEYTVLPNYIESKDGTIDVSIKLKTAPRPKEALLLQFEIYSGEAVDRKIIINDTEFTTFIRPKLRQLNRGFFISPDVHKGAKVINLSFKPVDAKKAHPLRLSSMKLSVLKPKEIEEKVSLLGNVDELFPVGFEQTRTSISLPADRAGSLIFGAKADICKENRLELKFKSKPLGQPKLILNSTPLAPSSPIEEDGAAFSYDCSNIKITNSNVLEVLISKADSYEITNKDDLIVALESISFISDSKD